MYTILLFFYCQTCRVIFILFYFVFPVLLRAVYVFFGTTARGMSWRRRLLFPVSVTSPYAANHVNAVRGGRTPWRITPFPPVPRRPCRTSGEVPNRISLAAESEQRVFGHGRRRTMRLDLRACRKHEIMGFYFFCTATRPSRMSRHPKTRTGFHFQTVIVESSIQYGESETISTPQMRVRNPQASSVLFPENFIIVL